ncbi:phosphate ABC transporter permease subunit PstC [Candidatus Sumerlaeota bacterium]|nr:phosphate ABC transporter permease subunit PstC [Candidatus Sumerlaeota bacterium]
MPSERLILSSRANLVQNILSWLGRAFLFLVTSVAAASVLFIIFYIARDAIPFFRLRGFTEFFTSTRWYPSGEPPAFGVLAIMLGSGLVTLGAIVVAVPLGVAAAMCLSDVLPFSLRQSVKPVIEILAAIPSVAYGFFALVVFAPILQQHDGRILAVAWYVLAVPFLFLTVVVLSDLLTSKIGRDSSRNTARAFALLAFSGGALALLLYVGKTLRGLEITTGTNALNVSIILGIMALPTIVSVSEDALQAVGRELREGSYALGATRAETMIKTIMPAASGGIFAAVLLGIMRALGETMVVWMASGNAAQIPQPWFNYLEPVRTLTATIAGDMGEADHVTGSARYHVLFAMGLMLLLFCFFSNLASEWIVSRQRKKLAGED